MLTALIGPLLLGGVEGPASAASRKKAADASYYLANRERIKQRSAARYRRLRQQDPEGLRVQKAEALRRWRRRNPTKVTEYARRRYYRDVAAAREAAKRRYAKHRERIKAWNRWYSKTNRTEINRRRRAKLQANPSLRVLNSLRSRIHGLVHKGLARKSMRTVQLIGCSPPQLVEWIERQFVDGMSWDNYGLLGWHIDHIRPCASFDLTDAAQAQACFHYTNLRPLWATLNWSKGSR